VPQEGSEYIIEVDNVVAAIGQRCSQMGIADTDLELSRWGTPDANEKTLQTNLPDVFTGGDCYTGADIAVRASAAGHLAAVSMHQFVTGETVTGYPELYNHMIGALPEVPPEVVAGFDERPVAHMPEIELERARTTFDEVETGFNVDIAHGEADRCLVCGCRAVNDCAIRKYATHYGVDPGRFAGAQRTWFVDDSHPNVRLEAHKCILCASCVRACEELLEIPALGFEGRGFAATVKPPLLRKLVDTLPVDADWAKLIDICPTGALTAKDARVAAWQRK